MPAASRSWRDQSSVVLIVLALVYYLVSTIVALRKIADGPRRRRSPRVGEIIEKTEPVNAGRRRHQRQPRRRRRRCSRACWSRRPAWIDADGPDRRPLPGRGRRRPAQLPREQRPSTRRASARSTRAARSRSPGSAARRRSPRPARPAPVLRNVESGSLAARRSTRRPPVAPRAAAALAGHRHRRPVQYEQRDDIGKPRKRLPDKTLRGLTSCRPRPPFEYERATQPRGRDRGARASAARTRAIIAGGHSLLPMMKLRLANPEHLIDINDLDRARLHPRGGRRDPDRRADPPRRPAQVRPAGRALPAVPRRRARDRRPGRAQPRHDRRLAVPGRRRRGPLGGLLGAQGEGRHPRQPTASASSAWTTSTSART